MELTGDPGAVKSKLSSTSSASPSSTRTSSRNNPLVILDLRQKIENPSV